MRIAVVGTGGVGGYFGGLLARSGLPVTFVARGEHYEAMSRNGLELRTTQGNFQLTDVDVVPSVSQLNQPDVVLVFVKTYSTQSMAEQLAEVVTPTTTVLTFQTGLENDRLIASILPHGDVYPGLAYINSRRVAPGVIEQISGDCRLVCGSRHPSAMSRLPAIADLFTSAGIRFTVTSVIERELWKKLTWISAFAGATVLFRSEVGPILNHPQGKEIFQRLLEEALSVGVAEGIHWMEADLAANIERMTYHSGPGRHAKTSMLTDLENGRRTEVETMHGALVERARRAGLKVPLLEAVYAIAQVHDQRLVTD